MNLLLKLQCGPIKDLKNLGNFTKASGPQNVICENKYEDWREPLGH